MSTSALTGESLPCDKSVSEYENSTVAKILKLVENSAVKKAKVERFMTRFAKYYTPAS